MSAHEQRAEALFRQGYNCAQAVFAAFSDVTGIPEAEALRLSSSFGGGMGRLREVCGAVSGMFLAVGALYGYDEPTPPKRAEHYARIQALAAQFQAQYGSIVCRELLHGQAAAGGAPAARTEEFYRKRPCLSLVRGAAAMLDDYLEKNPLPNRGV